MFAERLPPRIVDVSQSECERVRGQCRACVKVAEVIKQVASLLLEVLVEKVMVAGSHGGANGKD
jgi:hypothetical protein